MTAKRKTDDRAPMQLWAVMRANGTYVSAFALEDVARRTVSDMPGYGVVEFIEVRQPPPRDTEWGDGQYEHVTLSAGVTAGLRITTDGRVKLTIPGGELDVTDGGCMLGHGLHEAGKRAAQIRERRKELARRREERKAARP